MLNYRGRTVTWVALIIAIVALYAFLSRGERRGQAEFQELQSITIDEIDHALLIETDRSGKSRSTISIDDRERLESLAAALRSLIIWIPNHPHATEQWTLSVALTDGRRFEMEVHVISSEPGLARVYGANYGYRAQSADLLRWVRGIEGAKQNGL